jgi:hypothetical protein
MSQSFYGAQPKVVKNKSKFNSPYPNIMENPEIEQDEAGEAPLNIMYDKRVFRGNTYNMNMMKANNLTPMQKEELRIKAEREKKKVEMIKS